MALAALAWSCRGGLAGVPVADDYAFLERTSGLAPWSWFDSMGAAYYWRPVSRQLWFALMAPLLESQPALVAALHVALLALTYAGLWRIARRVFDAPAATAIAAFPLASEPARVLLAWPSASQHLLAMALAAWAVERALAGRAVLAAALALLAGLSHEAAWPALLLAPWLAWRLHGAAVGRRATVAALAAAALWAGGYAIARQHGVVLPTDAAARSFAAIGRVAAHTAMAQLNLEDLAPAARTAATAAYALVLLVAAALLARRAARTRLAARRGALAIALAWSAATLAPLVLVWPDWNAWRTSVASLGLGVIGIGALAALSPWLALAASVARIGVLLATTPAPATVGLDPIPAVSDLSFSRLTRLQRIVHSAERVVRARDGLPAAPRVRYWQMPLMAEVGFHGASAVRVWTGDSTASWRAYGGIETFRRREPFDALIEFNSRQALPARAIEPRAMALWRDAMDAMDAGQLARADSLLTVTIEAQPVVSQSFYASVSRVHARVAIARGDLERARRLNAIDRSYAGPSATTHLTDAWIALVAHDAAAARAALEQARALAPDDPEVHDLAARIAALR